MDNIPSAFRHLARVAIEARPDVPTLEAVAMYADHHGLKDEAAKAESAATNLRLAADDLAELRERLGTQFTLPVRMEVQP